MRNLEDPVALAALLTGLVDAEPSVAGAARQAARQLFLRTAPRDLLRLAEEVRYRTRSYSYGTTVAGAAWARLDVPGLLRASAGPGGEYVVRLASFHPSGYVREEAVRLLDGEQSGGELPFLLLRVNDWVTQVQCRAQIAVEQRLLPSYAWLFLHHHFLVDQLAQQRRNDLSRLHKSISEFLRSKAAESAREAARLDADRHVRRAAFVLSTESEGSDLRALILRGLRSDDLWLRIYAARTARTRLYGAALRETLGQARGDRSAPVRREALLGFIDEHPELRQSLLDPCLSLREMVRFYLRRKANLDFAALYREELERLSTVSEPRGLASRLATALHGLGETGKAEDADVVELYTIDARPRVRQAALHALGRLDADHRIATLGAALADDVPNVARTALNALGPRLTLVGEEALRRALSDQRDPRCREAIARALEVFRK